MALSRWTGPLQAASLFFCAAATPCLAQEVWVRVPVPDVWAQAQNRVQDRVLQQVQYRIDDAMQSRLGDLVDLTASSSGYLGVGVMEIDRDRARALNLSEERGVEISRLDEDSPAAKAGLQKGDVVLEYNGQRVEGTEQFARLVRETPAGREVKLLVSRNGATQPVVVTPGPRTARLPFNGDSGFHVALPRLDVPAMPQMLFAGRAGVLGVEVEPVEGQLAQHFGVTKGLLVRSVVDNSPAAKAGLKAGDVITQIDGTSVATPHELLSALMSGGQKRSTSLTITRERKAMPLSVTLDPDNPLPGARPTHPAARRVSAGQV